MQPVTVFYFTFLFLHSSQARLTLFRLIPLLEDSRFLRSGNSGVGGDESSILALFLWSLVSNSFLFFLSSIFLEYYWTVFWGLFGCINKE